MDLTEFVNARLNEDEAAAKALALSLERQSMGGAWSSNGPPVTGNSVTINTAWLPDRVLREITAKRAILAEYDRLNAAYEAFRHGANQAAMLAAQTAVEHLAAIWSDHPDYDPAWPLTVAAH
jgi:hypothetical protein